MKQSNSGTVARWVSVDDTSQWDSWLARLGGHPLQSRLWGDARRKVDGIEYRCLASCDSAGTVQAMARVEARTVPLLGSFAWIPKGPAMAADADFLSGLELACRTQGYIGWGASPYYSLGAVPAATDPTAAAAAGPRTLWLDLSQGRDALLGQLDAQWRYGVRRALREGLVVTSTDAAAQVQAFHLLCLAVSARKGFELPGSVELMLQLLQDSRPDAPVEARLFVAQHHGVLAGGVFILRAGQHLHYVWGAVDRAYARLRAGEALQWAAIEWGLALGCTRYDLEGIDPVNNPGTYKFKKKMGGLEVQLPMQVERALCWRGCLAIQALQLKRRFSGRPAAAQEQGD